MEQPEGFVVQGQENKVCKLVKSLYGLKQSPKQWHEKFDHTMLSHGFKINECDKCVYIKTYANSCVFVCLYQGTKFLRNWPIFRRKIGNRPAWKGNSSGKIEWDKIGEKSPKNRKGAILLAAVGPCCARAELARGDR